MSAAGKILLAEMALIQHRGNGFGPQGDDAIVRLFDLAGMAEFWDIALSEPMECESFVRALAAHFMVIEQRPGDTDADRLTRGAAASRAVDAVQAQLRSALRKACVDGEPWFITYPSQDKPSDPAPKYRKVLIYSAEIGPPKQDHALVVSLDQPSDGVDLSRLKVRPRPAVEWLLAMPKRQHLVPPSLAEALGTRSQPQAPSQHPAVQETTPVSTPPEVFVVDGLRPAHGPEHGAPYRTGMPGRPTSKDLLAVEWEGRVGRGEALSKKSEEADALLAWLDRNHPGAARPKKKTLQNQLSKRFT